MSLIPGGLHIFGLALLSPAIPWPLCERMGDLESRPFRQFIDQIYFYTATNEILLFRVHNFHMHLHWVPKRLKYPRPSTKTKT